MLHQLACSQLQFGSHELHHLSLLLLLHCTLHCDFSVLHLHFGDCARLSAGCAATYVSAEQDYQCTHTYCQGNYTIVLYLILLASSFISCGKSFECFHFAFQLSVAVCIGFLTAWSPYAIVSMWAAFGHSTDVPPMAFALAAIFAKSSTLYNPIVYLVFKPNFRKSLCRDVAHCRTTFCRFICQHRKGTCRQSHHNDECNSTRLSNGLPENHRTCRHCPCTEMVTGAKENFTDDSPQQTARILKGSVLTEVAVSQLSNELQSDFL